MKDKFEVKRVTSDNSGSLKLAQLCRPPKTSTYFPNEAHCNHLKRQLQCLLNKQTDCDSSMQLLANAKEILSQKSAQTQVFETEKLLLRTSQMKNMSGDEKRNLDGVRVHAGTCS